jgi:hypothetical protein
MSQNLPISSVGNLVNSRDKYINTMGGTDGVFYRADVSEVVCAESRFRRDGLAASGGQKPARNVACLSRRRPFMVQQNGLGKLLAKMLPTTCASNFSSVSVRARHL